MEFVRANIGIANSSTSRMEPVQNARKDGLSRMGNVWITDDIATILLLKDKEMNN